MLKSKSLIFCLLISFPTFAFNGSKTLPMNDIMVRSLKYLSSDTLEGRRPGNPGNDLATNYLENELKRMAIAGLNGSYKQEFTIFTRMLKNGKNELSTNSKAAPFEPISFSASGKLNNSDVVFVGYGISIPDNDPKINYDDYANVDVKNKIVIILTGDPAIGNPNSPFRHPDYMNYQNIIYKLQNAARKGASGVILVQDPLSIEDIANEPMPYFNDKEGGGKRFETLAGFTTNKWMNEVLKTENQDTLSLQKKIAQTGLPQSFYLQKSKWDLEVKLKKETGRVSNIIGIIPGTDIQSKNEVIVLGAHFDHLGMGGQSSMDPSRTPKIHNGADDNASGTSLLLKLAHYFSQKPQKRTILFTFFNAEEEGLLGSAHFVSSWANLQQQFGNLYAMINFDMVGRFDKEITLMGTGNAFEWEDFIEKLEGHRNINIRATKKMVGSSDHASFSQNKIPALFFTTGAHEDYHKSTDDFEKINFTAMQSLFSYSTALVQELTNPQTTLTFDPDSLSDTDDGRNRGYGSHLGCVPQFGQSDDIIGVYCTKASPNSPAEKAGIIAGDIVTSIGDIEIKNIYDLVFALRFYRSGDKVLLTWKRAEQVLNKEITLSTRSSSAKRLLKHNDCHHPGEL